MEKHISVLLEEAIEYLNIKEDGIYIDATLGFAGHSSQILKRAKKGFLIAFDKDKDAIKYSTEKLKKIGSNFKIYNTGFKNIKEKTEELYDKVDGILFDIGVSSVEIDEGQRGFSYMQNGPLDMRMDQNQELNAEYIINNYDPKRLASIFREYGEEKHAYKIANEIDIKRQEKPIKTTLELVEIIDRCYPYKEKRHSHPAKKVFQALRIEVNNELEELKTALESSLELLKPGGRLVVITFHSLEDRICKNIFKENSNIPDLIKGMPNIPENMLPDYKIITNKPILPSEEEMKINKRSKSAKLRVIERIK